MNQLMPLPSWLEKVLEHRLHFTSAGLNGLLDHHTVTNTLGELFAQGKLTPDVLANWLAEQVNERTRPTATEPTDGWAAYDIDPRAFWEQCWEAILGRKINIPSVPKIKGKTRKAIERYRLLLVFLPSITENDYPDSFVKPAWGRHIDGSKIEHKPLPGRWVLIEMIAKPNWGDPKGYEGDLLGQDLQITTRFKISWDHLTATILPRAVKLFGLPNRALRLPTSEEWNLIGNLFLWLNVNRNMSLPDLGSTNSWEGCLNSYDAGYFLVVGYRDLGGLADVNRNWHDNPNDNIAFRVLAVLKMFLSNHQACARFLASRLVVEYYVLLAEYEGHVQAVKIL
ncbi:hypothetical protein HZA85_01430 [Candidatus Uhrbacteria bacterium]|nr:hypothetical protein [Candidatus Uhrbacteria bacterium]